jgi:phosphoribosylglycinamide formyltransferase-1
MIQQQINSRAKKQIAVFASGAGSNAQKIIDHFRNSDLATIAVIVCNNRHAGVLDIAKKENIPALLIEKKRFNEDGYLSELQHYNISLVVLAGFLWKIPSMLIQAYPGKIINIHPALLPKYGGKNMYGRAVHEAVLAAGENESGITIHYVDEIYDHGKIIFQQSCRVEEGDTPETLAGRVHTLEHRFYPMVIEKLLSS